MVGGKLIPRPMYTDRLQAFKDSDLIKVITGIRRCGKSSVLALFCDQLRDQGIDGAHIIFMNLESLQYNHLVDYLAFYREVAERIPKSGRCYLMFDEIQQVSQWEKAVESFRLDFDVNIYITGSNAWMLSSELATYLSGRYVEIRINPLSFKEFLSFCTFPESVSVEERFRHYMRMGGMPALAFAPFDEGYCRMTLEGIYSTVVLKDIMHRAALPSHSTLERITKFLCQNIGSLISPNKMANVLQSEGDTDNQQNIARKTVLRYLELLDKSYIFSSVERYNIRGKELLRTQDKYYIVDLGFRSLLLGYRDTDRGHLLENIVYLELRRRGYRVYVGKVGEYEVDFVAETPQERMYIQVTETLLSEETRERELRPLRSIKDHYPKLILSLDWDFNTSYEGIRSVNVMDWLLE